MTARRIVAVLAALLTAAALLCGARGVVEVVYVAAGVGVLAAGVAGIDRLDRWGRRAHPQLRIVPDSDTTVVDRDSRWAS